MLKRIPPKNNTIKAEPQLPLQERVRLLMERLYAGKPLRPYNDPATVAECLKRGLVRRERQRRHARWSKTVLVPLKPAPLVAPARVPQPYAKRIADLDAAGLRRRGAPKAPAPASL